MNRAVTITLLVFLISFLTLPGSITGMGHSYKIVPEDDNIFLPCPGEEDKFIDKYFDMSKLTFTRVDDESIIVDGEMSSTFDLPSTERVKLSIEIEKEKSGQWSPTPMTISREDICDRMFVTTEYWHEFVKDFAGDQRVCPPTPGTIYSMSEIEAVKIVDQFPNGNMEGYYRMIFRLISENMNLCTMGTANVYKL